MKQTPAPPSERRLHDLACEVGDRLRDRGWQLATAESCTGGWIAKLITDRAGSSAWFDRGFVTYSNNAKCSMLDVPEEVLARHGAVSAAAVAAMVTGALRNSTAQVAVAVSGIAGPEGGTAEKPVGTVWFGWGTEAGEVLTERREFTGNRDAVRRYAAAHALQGVIQLFADEG